MATKRKTTTLGALLLGMFYIVFLSFFLVAGSLAGWLNQSSVVREGFIDMVRRTPPQEVFAGEGQRTGSLTILILGCDEERYYGGKQILNNRARSDMMMVARLDFDRNTVGAVSIPRDTWVDLPGYDPGKINKYHAIGGPELSIRAVNEVLPTITIDRAVVLNFDAFKEVVDMLGGVEVYVPKDMLYKDVRGGLDIDLKKGRQHLDGEDAMGFVRFRKGHNGGSDSDFERQKRQKDLMMALKDQMLKNWQSGPKVLDKSVQLSGESFSSREIAALLMFMQRVDNENIKMGQIPVTDIPGTYNLAVDRTRLEETLREYRVVPTEPVYARTAE
jgi:LCP family protein required for cell wall assembly